MILVTGANGVVGTPLCQTLQKQGADFLKVSRQAGHGYLQWNLSDTLKPESKSEKFEKFELLLSLRPVKTLIHCAPIWLLPDHLSVFDQTSLRRVIAFSSTSVLSKQASTNAVERALADQLAVAEHALHEQCDRQGWNLTILRPSLIYGYGRDQNIMHIARFIHRYGVILLVGKANGQRQPVHADDLVNACISIIQNSKTYDQTYNLAGQEVLSYRQMVERIFAALRKQPRIVRLPLTPFRLALRVAAKATNFAYTPEMADRMNQNLSYDIAPAMADFGFNPQKFLQQPQRDLMGLI